MITAYPVWPGVCRLSFPFNAAINAALKEGIRWFDYHGVLGKKAWYVPFGELSRIARDTRIPVTVEPDTEIPLCVLRKDLLPHQHNAATLAVTDNVRLLQFDTGTGKSYTAIAAAEHAGPRWLIAAPRIVLSNWHGELAKWGCGEAWEQRTGRKIPDEQPNIVLCSYGSIHKLPKGWSYDALIYDEIHAAIHAKSKRSRALVDLSMRHPRAMRLGLTATPISAELSNLWSQLHCLCPHRWGTFKQWVEAYHDHDYQGYEGALQVRGIREDRKQAWLAAVQSVSSYTSQSDLGDKLPAVSWHVKRLGSLTGSQYKACPADLALWRKEQSALSSTRVAALGTVIAAIPESEPVAVVTYLRETAERVAAQYGLTHIDGSILPHKRADLLAQSSRIAITMMCANEGIDLRKYTNVIVAESYPVPRFVEQMLGRFIRLFATNPVSITFATLAGTSDVIITNRLVDRLKEQSVLISAGKIRSGLLDSLERDTNSADFLAEIADQLGSWDDDDDC